MQRSLIELKPGAKLGRDPRLGRDVAIEVSALSRAFHKFANVFKSPVELRSTVQAKAG
jgi:hypothetical protein